MPVYKIADVEELDDKSFHVDVDTEGPRCARRLLRRGVRPLRGPVRRHGQGGPATWWLTWPPARWTSWPAPCWRTSTDVNFVPTLVLLKDGEPVARIEGYTEYDELVAKIAEAI